MRLFYLLIILITLSFSTAKATEFKSLQDHPEERDYIQVAQMCLTVYYNFSIYVGIADEMNKMLKVEEPGQYLNRSFVYAKHKYEMMKQFTDEKNTELVEQGFNVNEINQLAYHSAMTMVQLIQNSTQELVKDKTTGRKFILTFVEQTEICDNEFFPTEQ